MANISKNVLRSRLAQSTSNATSARGFQKNPQDFTELVGQRMATTQEYLKKNWHYLPDSKRAYAARLTTKFRDVEIDTKTGQFEMALA
jgi:hypothetical protein